MTNNASYRVSSNGDILSGFNTESVVESFSSMFGVPVDKASEFVSTKKLIKKGLTEEQAEIYRSKLTEIGIEVVVDCTDVDAAMLSLVDEAPANEAKNSEITQTNAESVAKPRAAQSAEIGLAPADAPLPSTAASMSSAAQMVCPKCKLEQNQADDCKGCGIIIAKYTANNTDQNSAEAKQRLRERRAAAEKEDELSVAGFLMPVVVAILGALVWKVIASVFGWELGIVAWGIGGAIGFAAVMTGSKGQSIAIYCAVLALLAIMGGRYLAYTEYKQDYIDIFSEGGLMSELEDAASEWEREAAVIAEIADDDSKIRQFMVDYEYTEESKSVMVTRSELADFKEYTMPYLIEVASNGTEELFNISDSDVQELSASMEEISVWDLMQEDLGLLDLLFLFLGISTAFKLALNGRETT